MKILNFKELKESSVYITPNFSVLQTRRYKFSLLKLFSYLLMYTLTLMILFLLVLTFTPAKELVFLFENQKLAVQTERISELEEKIGFLSAELEKISSSDMKLKYAIIMGASDSIDTNSAVYDSLRAGEGNKLPVEGNIMRAFRKLFLSKKNLEDLDSNTLFFIRPAEGYLVRSFDPSAGHLGIDFASKTGAPVVASANGMIIMAGYTPEDGYKIIIEHENNFFSIYKHCSMLLVKERDFVIQGEVIAQTGSSGINTSGPHLHFEIWKDGKAIDPQKFLINLGENK